MTSKTWNEIYELVGRVERRALEAQDWEAAKDADRITALLLKLSQEIGSECPLG